jgi:hypothetical protein
MKYLNSVSLITGLSLLASTVFGNFLFVNETGKPLLIQPAKHSRYCKLYESVPEPGYFISLGQDSKNKISLPMKGWGKPGQECTQAFNVYASPDSSQFLGYLTVRSHDTDGYVDEQVLVSQGSKLKAGASKNGKRVIITS